MALLKTIDPKQAEGEIKDGYLIFLEKAGSVPKPMELLSVSPELFKMQVHRLGYFMKHPNLSFS